MGDGEGKTKKDNASSKKSTEGVEKPKEEIIPSKEPSRPVEKSKTTSIEKPSADLSQAIQPKKEQDFGSRAKNWIIILLVILILGTLGTFFLWRTGINDLKKDNSFLIVVQEKGVAKAGSIYDLSTDKADIINVEELPSVTDLGRFFHEGGTGRRIDRLVIIKVDTITALSTEPFLEYNGKKIPSRDVGGYITGALWDVNLAGDDPPWKFRANLLSEWVELYDDKILDANYGSQVYNTIFVDYRNGNIVVYPRNAALIILKYIPLEQIFL